MQVWAWDMMWLCCRKITGVMCFKTICFSVPVYPGAAAKRRHLGQLREHPYQRSGALSWKICARVARLVSIVIHSVPLYFLIVYLLWVLRCSRIKSVWLTSVLISHLFSSLLWKLLLCDDIVWWILSVKSCKEHCYFRKKNFWLLSFGLWHCNHVHGYESLRETWLPPSSWKTLKMKSPYSSEVLVSTHKTKWCHNPRW